MRTKHERGKQGRRPIRALRGASPEDAYFYTDEWQEKEREADEAFARGALSDPETADEAIAAFHAASGRSKRRLQRPKR